MREDDSFDDRDIVRRVGTFSVLLSKQSWYREDEKLPAHKKVLRPLLNAATDCWVYGIKPGSDVERSAGEMLEREKGRHRVSLEGDPITGHELFWNAYYGKRGTIVICIPRRKLDAERVFRGGHGAYVTVNFRTCHTPAAIRFARNRVESSDIVAVCLPRNNGIRHMDIYVKPRRALALFEVALHACGRWY